MNKSKTIIANQQKPLLILALTPILILVGQLLNLVTPSIAGVIRPDFALSFLFLSVMIRPTLKQAVLAGSLVVLTSLILGGNIIFQIPSIFDRIFSAIFCLAVYHLAVKTGKKFFLVKIGAIFLTSTLVSGLTYVIAVYLIGSLFNIPELLTTFKMGLPLLFIAIVATATVNYFLGVLLYKIASKVL